MNNWIEKQLPSGTPEEIGVIQLAWLGDSVWELHQRLKHIHMHSKSKDLHLSVVKEVKAKSQVDYLCFIKPSLNALELDLIRRARNKTKRCPKSLKPAIYAQSTAFETLIGWLFLKDPKRLSQLIEQIDSKQLEKL